jgi:hypothetical protein
MYAKMPGVREGGTSINLPALPENSFYQTNSDSSEFEQIAVPEKMRNCLQEQETKIMYGIDPPRNYKNTCPTYEVCGN